MAKTPEQTKKLERKEISTIFRKADFTPSTIDEKKRTVEVVFSTGARVLRMPWFEDPFFEELSLDKEHVRLDRLLGGAPVLNNHNSFSLDQVIGVVESASVDGKRGVATLRFSERSEVDPIWKDVKDGILRNVSVGYRVHKFERIRSKDENEPDVMRAVDWEPYEISLVGMPADKDAQVRSESEKFDCEILDEARDLETEKKDVAQKNENGVSIKESTEINPLRGANNVDEKEKAEAAKKEQEIRAEAVKLERERIAGINEAVRVAGLDSSFADELIKSEISLDGARGKIFEKMAEKVKPTTSRAVVTHDGGEAERKSFLEGIENALSHRVAPKETFKKEGTVLTDNGKRFRTMSFSDMVRAYGNRIANIDGTFLNKRELMKRVLSTGDFGDVLANVQNKSLKAAYDEMPSTWQPLANEVDNDDFKTIAASELSAAASLLEKPEGGEIQGSDLTDAKEQYNIKVYARKIPFTFEAMVNDDLRAFQKMPQKMAQAAARTLSDKAWAQITSNPTMGDGVALFHSTHKNLGTPGAISLTTLSELVKLAGLQTGMAGEALNIVPKHFITGPTKELLARQFLSQNMLAEQASNINPWAGTLNLIIEPRIETGSGGSDDDFYIAGDKSQVDILEIAYLPGQRSPQVDSYESKETLDMNFNVLFMFGVKIIGFRGIYKNAGS